MRLLNTDQGRVVQLVSPDEVRPPQGLDLPRLVRAVGARYGFDAVPPDLTGFAQPTGLRFERGRFVTANLGDAAIFDLSLFNDGIIATCADTNIADALINDATEWLIQADMIRRPIRQRPRTYTSNVIVEFDIALTRILEQFLSTSAKLHDALLQQYGWDHPTSLQRLAFSADPTNMPPYRNTLFAIERRGSVSFDQRWFWSGAPLPLAIHLDLLKSIEDDFLELSSKR
jgi:hypothetical protein